MIGDVPSKRDFLAHVLQLIHCTQDAIRMMQAANDKAAQVNDMVTALKLHAIEK